MVIPVGASPGAPLLVGPPPPELLPRLKIIKVCVIVLICALVVRVVVGAFIIDVFSIVWNSLNAILVAFVGIFLLKDDDRFGPIHNCIVRTCFQACPGQCEGGMSCLCTWFMVCAITSVFSCLPFAGSDIIFIVNVYSQKIVPNTLPTSDLIEYCLFIGSMIAAFIAQVIGGYQGYKGFTEMTQRNTGFMGGGDWADDNSMGSAGGGAGGSMYRVQSAPTGNDRGGNQGTSQPQAQGFKPFGGQGQRLGG